MNTECRILNVEVTRFILLLFASGFWILDSGFSQNVTINGKADTSYIAHAGMLSSTIFAFTYDDYISYKEKELGSSPIDEKGNFSISLKISEPTYLFLMIENAKAEMIAEPNKTYQIQILPKDSDAVQTLSAPIAVEIEFVTFEYAELNFLIADFSSRYETFLEEQRPLITKKNKAIFGRIDTMKITTKEKFSGYKNPFLNTYIDYSFASLEESITLKDREIFFNLYIKDKPILLNNYEYMEFFNQFFSAIGGRFITTDKMLNEINQITNFASLMLYFSESKYLANDTLREAVILKSLSEYYKYDLYKPERVAAIFEQAATDCKAEENKRTALNILKRMNIMKPGTPAPAFSFQNKNGKIISLSDFKGKYVYLNFWASWCSSCIQEMAVILELKKLYGDKIEFVSISVDKKPDLMRKFLLKNPRFDWIFLYGSNVRMLKEEYNVLTVPTYYLIDPKGNVLKSPAQKPQYIEPDFIQIKKKK